MRTLYYGRDSNPLSPEANAEKHMFLLPIIMVDQVTLLKELPYAPSNQSLLGDPHSPSGSP